jgi:hypothetical protein
MNAAVGLGDSDPFKTRRDKARDSILPGRRQDDDEDNEPEQKATVVTDAPAPPTRELKGRVPLSARIPVDRMKLLKRYQHKYGATFQAVIDQMVDEYLERRNLLPPG